MVSGQKSARSGDPQLTALGELDSAKNHMHLETDPSPVKPPDETS